jgi:hypothetical protein
LVSVITTTITITIAVATTIAAAIAIAIAAITITAAVTSAAAIATTIAAISAAAIAAAAIALALCGGQVGIVGFGKVKEAVAQNLSAGPVHHDFAKVPAVACGNDNSAQPCAGNTGYGVALGLKARDHRLGDIGFFRHGRRLPCHQDDRPHDPDPFHLSAPGKIRL